MEGCSKTSAGAVPGLPDDPLVEILSRVPAKSVCRFKCVSKAWRDLIADPGHRKKLRQPMQGLFFQTAESKVSEVVDDDLDDDESDDNELDPISFGVIDLSHLTVSAVPLDIDPCFSFLTELTGIRSFLFDSCNGLILFGQCRESSSVLDGYIICNPTTRQWSAVPACGSPEALNHTYLAFDPAVSSQFHLVQFQMPDVDEDVVSLHVYLDVVSLHVYSSETRTWSQNQIDEQNEQGQLEGWHHQFTLDVIGNQCSFVNGFLHLIVWGSAVQHILVVDIQGKARRMITVPGMADVGHGHAYVCYLGQSQGHLHCVTKEPADEYNVKLSTWILQDYDTQEWVLKNTVNSWDVFRETGVGVMLDFQVVDIHQDCNVVLFFHRWSYKLIAYNIDHKEVSVIATFKDLKFRSEFARYIPYFSESPALTNKY